MTSYGVRFEGPAALALRVATALADADGVELIVSDDLVTLDERRVVLRVTVEGTHDAVAGAIAGIRSTLPADATIATASDAT